MLSSVSHALIIYENLAHGSHALLSSIAPSKEIYPSSTGLIFNELSAKTITHDLSHIDIIIATTAIILTILKPILRVHHKPSDDNL